jgi:hypothetical protein
MCSKVKYKYQCRHAAWTLYKCGHRPENIPDDQPCPTDHQDMETRLTELCHDCANARAEEERHRRMLRLRQLARLL